MILLLLLGSIDSFTIDCSNHRFGKSLPNGSGHVLCHVFLTECCLWVFVGQVSKLVLDQVLEGMKHVMNDFRWMCGHLFFVLVDVLVLHLGPVVYHFLRNSLLWVGGSLLKHAASLALFLEAVWPRVLCATLASWGFRQTHSHRNFDDLHLLKPRRYGVAILSSILCKVEIIAILVLEWGLTLYQVIVHLLYW